MTDAPHTLPGEVAGRPKLVVRYRTDPTAVDALLPPGLDRAGADPVVTIGVYCVPVLGEPEHGISVRIPASFGGVAGSYPLGIGIDQEAAIFASRERNGQPKYPCDVRYFRMGDRVEASAAHQGHTFVSFAGTVGDPVAQDAPEATEHEWWIKAVRAVGGAAGYDYPPHVVGVRTVGRTWLTEPVDGELTLRSSPWDPVADLLPARERLGAELVHTRFSAREIALAGPLDPDGFAPFADTIGGSRWPGEQGGPRRTVAPG